jgi:hypothetical protein
MFVVINYTAWCIQMPMKSPGLSNMEWLICRVINKLDGWVPIPYSLSIGNYRVSTKDLYSKLFPLIKTLVF